MSACEVHVANPTDFVVTIKACDGSALDISTATAMDFVFRKPDLSVIARAASFLTDGSDGVLRYIASSSDLDQSGTWSYQAEVTLPSGLWYSDIVEFEVYQNLRS